MPKRLRTASDIAALPARTVEWRTMKVTRIRTWRGKPTLIRTWRGNSSWVLVTHSTVARISGTTTDLRGRPDLPSAITQENNGEVTSRLHLPFD